MYFLIAESVQYKTDDLDRWVALDVLFAEFKRSWIIDQDIGVKANDKLNFLSKENDMWILV